MKIIIPGNPIAKKRTRCKCHGNKPWAYDVQKKEMETIRKEILRQWIAAFESNDVEIKLEASRIAQAQSFRFRCTFLFEPAQSLSLSKKNEYFWGFENHITKPDCDNLMKLYQDCATGIIWKDDSQITNCQSIKNFNENPRTELEIMVDEKLNVPLKAKEILKVFSPSKLKEIVRDMQAFWPCPPERIENIRGIAGEASLLTGIAGLLGEFAEKHADDLKKIKKYGDVIKELSKSEFNLKEILQ